MLLLNGPKSFQYLLEDGNFYTEMSFKAFRFLFIILNVDVVCPLENCVKLSWNHTFNFHFFPNDSPSFRKLEGDVVNFTNFCLQNHLPENETRRCKSPVVNVTFPLISGAPNITLKMLHRPVLAAKDASAGTAAQILRALEEIWQLCVLCLMAAILSGILIWFFVSKL